MTDNKIKTVPLTSVTLKEGFWFEKNKLIKEKVIPYQWDALNDNLPEAEPSHAVENFKIAAGEKEGEFAGMVFQDSDLAKWLEAVGYVLATEENKELEKLADQVIDLLEKAQRPDGYLNTYFILKEPDKRWTNLRDWHELYCAGHLIEAAVAYYQATGKKKVIEVVSRFVDYIDQVFGSEPGKKRGYPGHEEIELALVKLYRITGKERYLNLSKYFIDERGQKPNYFVEEAEARGDDSEYWPFYGYKYNQAHSPVKEQSTAEGHSVRAMYLYSGMADVALETGDQTLAEACKTLWDNVTKKRMYVTGGIGSSGYGEAFTLDYDLPDDTAYTETCAAIGLVFWADRMFKLDPDSKYIDIMERALYNGVLSGINLQGDRFFYVNPLSVWPEAATTRYDHRHVKIERQKWFGCACCPPNLARLVASIGQYIYAHSNEAVYINLYADSKTKMEIKGKTVAIEQTTAYPWQEKVEITVKPEETLEFAVRLRKPAWCDHVQIRVNGETVESVTNHDNGYYSLNRQWHKGDVVELILAMPVKRLRANPELRENIGKVAIQRGPIVYCLEEVDNGANLPAIVLPSSNKLTAEYLPELLGGVTVVKGSALRIDESNWQESLYHSDNLVTKSVDIQAVPYFTWNNRGAGEMLVWLRETL